MTEVGYPSGSLPRAVACFAVLLSIAGCASSQRRAPQLTVWAWERPEDLRFLPPEAAVAVQTGFIEISGGDIVARGRRFALKVARPPQTAMVHIQIDERRPVRWSPVLARRVAAAALQYATVTDAPRIQIDFEVRASQRAILLDVLRDVREGMGRGRQLSMTALASWCDDERWLDAAPVDEIVPMLFRMGRSGPAIRQRLTGGGDFGNPRCRSALAISTDEPIARAPAGRRIYMFDPRSWTEPRFAAARRTVEGWR